MFDILSPEENIQGSFVLEASAGTGKTFAIQHLFVRLLLEGDSPPTVNEILAITFTQDAQKEMKQRIWTTLKQVYQETFQETGSEKIPYLVDTKVSQGRIAHALSHFFSNNISTIHGFFHKMLQAFTPSFAKKGEKTLYQARKEALYLFLQCEKTSSCMQYLILRRIATTKTLHKLFSSWDYLSHQKDPWEVFQQTVTQWGQLNWDVVHFESDFEAMHAQYKKPAQELLSQAFPLLKAWMQRGGRAEPGEWEQWLLHEGCFVTKIRSENKRKKIQTHPRFYPELEDVLIKIFSPLYEVFSKGRALDFFIVQKSQRYVLKNVVESPTFDGLLYAMYELIENASLIETIRKRFRYVIVDEFQDTDPIQWHILQKLFLEGKNPSSIVIVGDPKQSIYGFRKADVTSYFQAVSLLGKNKVKTLSTNYRSTPSLNDALNALFSSSKIWLDLPHLPGSLSFQKTLSPEHNIEEPIIDDPPCTLCVATGKYSRAFPTKEMEQELVFPFFLTKMGDFLKNKKSVAVLVKDRYQAERVFAFLQQNGFPTQMQRGRLVVEGRAFQLVYSALKAFLFSREKEYFAFLFYSLIGLEGQKEKALSKTFSFQESWGRWQTFCDTFDGSAVLFLQVLRKHSFLATSVSACLLKSPEIEEEFLCLEDLLAREGNLSVQKGLAFLESWKHSSVEEQRSLSLPSESSPEKISIMTVFASKGLEFDAVFVLGPACAPSHLIEDEEEHAEEMRELYVAMTRAKQFLYVFLFLEEDGRLSEKGLTTTVERFFSLMLKKSLPLCLQDIELPSNILESGVQVMELKPSVLWQGPLPIQAVGRAGKAPPKISLPLFPSKKVSFTSLKKRGGQTLATEKEALSGKVLILPLGLDFGTFLHKILADVLWGKHFSNIEKLASFLRSALKFSCYSSCEKILQEVFHHLFFTPFYKGLSLSAILKSPFSVETPFVFWKDGLAFEGKIDLLIFIEGKVYFVDWKSHFLGENYSDYSYEVLLACMERENYFLQSAVYAEAICRGLWQRSSCCPEDIVYGGGIFYFIRGKAFYYVSEAHSNDVILRAKNRGDAQGSAKWSCRSVC